MNVGVLTHSELGRVGKIGGDDVECVVGFCTKAIIVEGLDLRF